MQAQKGAPAQTEAETSSNGGFLKLLILQIALGAVYTAGVIAAFQAEPLAPFKSQITWFFELQYTNGDGRAHAGPRDACYVMSAFVAVICARAAFQLATYFLLQLTRPDLSYRSQIRCTEQAWCVVYYASAAIWGIKLLQNQPYTFSAPSLWVDFPHYLIDQEVKRYYLTIFAFWFAQIFIIHLEDRRKDHWQMLTHHFVTCMLVLGSYQYCYTRIGHLVMIMMDTVDIFLSLAKVTKYLKWWGWLTDSIFVVFLLSWVVLRHFVYMYEMIYGAFPAFKSLVGRCAVYNGEVVQCFSPAAHYTFFALALALQAITIMWLVLIVRVVNRVIRGDGAADSRSDSESE